MTSAFVQFNQILDRQRWALRFWDGRPTGFVSGGEEENLLIQALRDNDIPALNALIDEVGNESSPQDGEDLKSLLMMDVAELIADYSYPESLHWYVTTSYPPLLLSFTPELFISSPDLQDALVTWTKNLYTLYRWWLTQPRGVEAINLLHTLFTPNTLGSPSPSMPSLSLEAWRTEKKTRFLLDRKEQGFTVPDSDLILTPTSPRRQPRVLPPRQGDARY